jgi:hypothetical protein
MNEIVKVSIKGVSPLLMHRFPMVEIKNIEKKSMEEQAEISAYRCPDTNQLYIPGVAIRQSLINGAAYSKGKKNSSLSKSAAACVLIFPERCLLGLEKYEIDSRPVVIRATKGRIIRHRPRLDKWQCQFELEYDPDLLKEEQVRTIVDDAGSRVGLLDFSPRCKGPFGRFSVVEWKKD